QDWPRTLGAAAQAVAFVEMEGVAIVPGEHPAALAGQRQATERRSDVLRPEGRRCAHRTIIMPARRRASWRAAVKAGSPSCSTTRSGTTPRPEYGFLSGE